MADQITGYIQKLCARPWATALFGLLVFLHSNLLWAAKKTVGAAGPANTFANIINDETSVGSRPLMLMGAMAVLALVPFVLIMVTSFVKIAVVLSIVRQAIGTQQIPPTQVITGLATILTIYIMLPVGLDIYRDIKPIVQSGDGISVMSAQTVDLLFKAAVKAKEPAKSFLLKHSHMKDRDMFYKLAWRMRKPVDRQELTDTDFIVLVPSFVISELKEAFQIGFIIFIPFLVVDIVVANILMALGMQMLSPTTISLPFKILLFVMVDGWYMITKGLVLTYQ